MSMALGIEDKTRQGLLWSTIIKIIFHIYRFSISIVIARLLDPQDFGIMAIATMVVFYANSFTEFGFNNALIQLPTISKRHVNTVFTINLIISFTLLILTILLSEAIAHYFHSPESEMVLKALSIVFVVSTLYEMPRTLLRRSIDFKYLSIVNALQSVIRSIITLCLAILGFKYWALVWGQIVPMLLATFVLMFKAKWIPKIYFSTEILKSIIDFSIWSFLRSQLFYLNTYIPQFFIGRFLGPIPLGFFGKAYSLCEIPLQSIASSINSVMYSSFSRMQKDKNRLKAWLKKIILMESAVIIPIFFGLFSVSSHFVLVVLGDKWADAIHPIQILCFAGIFNTFNGISTSLNIAVGDYRNHTIKIAISIPLQIIFCIAFVRNGVSGIAYSFTVVSAILSVLFLKGTVKNTGIPIKELFFPVFPYLISSLAMLVSLNWLSNSFFSEKSITNLIWMICSGAIIYFLGVVSYNYINDKGLFYPLYTARKKADQPQ